MKLTVYMDDETTNYLEFVAAAITEVKEANNLMKVFASALNEFDPSAKTLSLVLFMIMNHHDDGKSQYRTRTLYDTSLN